MIKIHGCILFTFLYTVAKGFEWDGSVGISEVTCVCEEGLFLICVRPPIVNRVGREGGGGGL